MEHIFIVDDNPSKLADLEDSARALFPQAEIKTFEHVDDFRMAVLFDSKDDILRRPNSYLLIIDMQMPLYRHERIDPGAGISLLAMLQVHDMQCPAIIASSEMINESYAENAYDYYIGFLRTYNSMQYTRDALKDVLAAKGHA